LFPPIAVRNPQSALPTLVAAPPEVPPPAFVPPTGHGVQASDNTVLSDLMFSTFPVGERTEQWTPEQGQCATPFPLATGCSARRRASITWPISRTHARALLDEPVQRVGLQ